MNSKIIISGYLSKKLKLLSFIAIIFVVYLHSNNITINFDGETEVIKNGYNSFFQDFISHGITRIAVPLFFMISGFLFFINIENDFLSKYKIKVKKRIKTLLVPYLFWSIIGLVFYYLLQSIQFSRPFFTKTLIKDFLFLEYFDVIFLNPIPYQFWFIRDLMILILISPLLFKLFKLFKYFFIFVLLVLWFLNIDLVILSNESILFYSVGIVLVYKQPRIESFEQFNSFDKLIFLWLLMIFFKTALSNIDFAYGWLLILLHKLSVLIGLFAFWRFYDTAIVKNNYLMTWLNKYAKYTFIVFAMHEPLLTILKKGFYYLLGNGEFSSFIIYIFTPIIAIVTSIFVGKILRKYFTKGYMIITGNR